MTRDYIYENMTWAEVSDALAYVSQYEDPQRFYGKHLKTKLNDWLYRGRDTLASDLRKALGDMRRKNGR